MSDHIRIERHNGREIWIADYSNLAFKELEFKFEIAKKKVINSGRDNLLWIDIATGVKMNRQTGDALRSFANEAKPFIKEYAAVGVSGFVRPFATMLRVAGLFNVKLFDTEQEAIEFLKTC
ncbi:MAG: hypothetical protein RIM99_05535 [Cyclobacteriaceae bacterium]